MNGDAAGAASLGYGDEAGGDVLTRGTGRLAILALSALAASWLCPSVVSAAASPWAETEQTAVRLVAATEAVGTAKKVSLGLHFRLREGWKIYWRSPGDAGYPPNVDWSGSENLAGATLSWPAPERFSILGFESLGYTGEVVLPITATLARAGEPLIVRATVEYLTCREICIPYEAKLALHLPAGAAEPSRPNILWIICEDQSRPYGCYGEELVTTPNVDRLAAQGARFTHHSSIAPTGTISLSLANNASNGIEPSFAHHYSRNLIRPGRKAKEKIEVFSYELLAYRTLINARAKPGSDEPGEKLPDYFITADDVSPTQHVDIQAAAQRWVDSSISKTANVPTDYPFEAFKDIYRYAWRQGLKGCTTFRFNPEAFQGVLVKEKDLENTLYEFTLDDGSKVTLKGNEQVEYDGEVHTAANLFDALKEGTYGKY